MSESPFAAIEGDIGGNLDSRLADREWGIGVV